MDWRRLFPLSLTIFWRFMLVLPLWTIFYLFLVCISVLGLFSVLGSLPGLGLIGMIVIPLLMTAISYIIMVHPYLIGIGIGLGALGVRRYRPAGQMLKTAVGFGVVEAILATIVVGVSTAIAMVFMFGVLPSLMEISAQRPTDPIAATSIILVNGALNIVGLAGGLAAMMLRAAMLPAMAGAAAGKGGEGAAGLFDGFGENFLSMMALLLLITLLSTFIMPLVAMMSFGAIEYLGLSHVLTEKLSDIVLYVSRGREIEFNLLHLLAILIAISVSVWLFSLQCAGAALSYASRSIPTRAQEQQAQQERETLKQDIGDLLRSRMPTHDD